MGGGSFDDYSTSCRSGNTGIYRGGGSPIRAECPFRAFAWPVLGSKPSMNKLNNESGLLVGAR